MSKVLFLIVVLFPSVLFAQEVAPAVEAVAFSFVDQPWYAIAGEVVVFANAVTMIIPDSWASKIPGLNYLNTLLNWLAMNVFKNKNQA